MRAIQKRLFGRSCFCPPFCSERADGGAVAAVAAAERGGGGRAQDQVQGGGQPGPQGGLVQGRAPHRRVQDQNQEQEEAIHPADQRPAGQGLGKLFMQVRIIF